ncbi:MAG: signal recognition particle protein Srp54 [Erysipelotrichaceae bacterium]|nr:MAG: signal recognition particle protein [Erysipelotrichaceae bacterium]TXT19428.1 MAG: signal recognition particle protein Srp54 [Erysipelotrichaceae bacterium]
MALERLSTALSEAFKKLTKTDKINESHLDNLLKEVKVALLEADVHTMAIDVFLNRIKDEALGQKIFGSLKPNEALMKIVYDQLVDLLGSTEEAFAYPASQHVTMMLVGLQGSGKTTSAAKLAHFFKSKGRKPYLIAADLMRPAAIDQLEILGTSLNVKVYTDRSSKNALQVVKDGIKASRNENVDTIIIDTAGRLHIDETLMNELVQIKSYVNPTEVLLTVDALSGQDAMNVAASFNQSLNISGLIVTKFDGDSKGGAVLSAKTVAQVNVKLVGTGEKTDEYDLFYPDRMASRLIGGGDLLSLVEQAQTKLDTVSLERSANRIMEGQFDFNDLLDQITQMSKMGSLKSMLSMLPGMGQMAQQVNDADSKASMIKSKAIILSMTLEEREDASLLRASRKNRIAKGSGVSVQDVNRLISQYEKTKEQMRMVSRMAKNAKGFR